MTLMARTTLQLRDGQPLQIPPGVSTYAGVLEVTFTGDAQLTILDPDGNVWFAAGIPGAADGETATVSHAISDQAPLDLGPYPVSITGTGTVEATLVTSSA